MAFLRNCWYCAGWSADLGGQPTGIKILNEEIVLFRDSEGRATALSGICPHRFAPLSKGKVVGDRIQCPYHGLEFNQEGRCMLNPHGRGLIPERAKLQSYPLAERHGALWIWMGDPGAADESKIPEFDFVSDRESWAGATGYLRMDASYELVIDNLLDLTHADYIHGSTLAVDQTSNVKMEADFDFSDSIISSKYTMLNAPPTPVFKAFTHIEVGDMVAQISLHPPSTFLMTFSLAECGGDIKAGQQVPSAHFIVPETETSCHYFYAISRNEKLEDNQITKNMLDILVKAFVEEDAPMIRDCQDGMRGEEFWALRPVVLETDVAAIQARRTIAKLLRLEQEGESDSQQASSG
ncbi:vanillate monooxygenase [gamma proteobacterium BDW918]|nr:vanillate monooxygenase [gamma proteobacterium BDW918]